MKLMILKTENNQSSSQNQANHGSDNGGQQQGTRWKQRGMRD
jgi:hypothetical protein